MELERVGPVSVGGVLGQIGRQIDNRDGFEWTFLEKPEKELHKLTPSLRREIFSSANTWTQMPQPIHKGSAKKATGDSGVTSMHSLPMRTTGQLLLHSWRHFFGLHLSRFTMAILVSSSWTLFLSCSGIIILAAILFLVVRSVDFFSNLFALKSC